MTAADYSGYVRGHPGSRPLLPERFCNYDRLLWALEQRNVTDGLVISLRPNVFYLSGYTSKVNQSLHETNGFGAIFLSPKDPEHPILVVPDFELASFVVMPTWIKDIRAYQVALPYDMPVDGKGFDRYVPSNVLTTEWGENARATYEESLIAASKRALADLGISSGRVAFDNVRFAQALAKPEMEIADAYDLMKFVRQVKTSEEITLMRAAAAINERAIEMLVKQWASGMTWFDLNHAYHVNVASLGGFVHDPGGVILANPPTIEPPVFFIDSGREDFELVPGMNIMLDCHGTLNQYCWDAGKTWSIGAERTGVAAAVERAGIEAMHAVNAAVRPGVELRELQAIGLRVFEQMRIPDPRRTSIFFHSLGLEHSDVEVLSRAGRPDWRIEEGQLVATHVIYPGDQAVRYYLEDNAIAHEDGGESLYSWSFETLVND